MLKKALFIGIMSASLAACGFKGPLYLLKKNHARMTGNASAPPIQSQKRKSNTNNLRTESQPFNSQIIKPA